MKTYNIEQFEKEFESHLGGFGFITLFYHLVNLQGRQKKNDDFICKATSNEVLSWNFKTDMELMDIGSELFKQEFLEAEAKDGDFNYTTDDIINKIGKDNVLEVKENGYLIGYLVKEN